MYWFAEGIITSRRQFQVVAKHSMFCKLTIKTCMVTSFYRCLLDTHIFVWLVHT